MLNMMTSLAQLDILSKCTSVKKIMETNERSIKYGLILSQTDAIELVEARSEALCANGRIEIGSATIEKIIDAFCNSSYIIQQDYTNTLHELLEIFYYMKNETLDLISDDELIELMKNYFESRCRGSLELLKDRELEKMARNLRYGLPDYSNMDEEDEQLDEEEF